jgi:hypothetical protein
VQLCSSVGAAACLGPHALSQDIKVTYAPSCASGQAQLAPLVAETLQLATVFRGSPRTYDEGPYTRADSYCPERCVADVDCGGGSCYIPAEQLWGAPGRAQCSPSSKFAAKCGCCYGSGGSPTLPSINTLTIECGDTTSAPHEEGYTLNVTAARGIPSDGKIAIASSTPKGAAYALTTLAQLLRYDDGPWVGGSQHVLDFVPLSIAGA